MSDPLRDVERAIEQARDCGRRVERLIAERDAALAEVARLRLVLGVVLPEPVAFSVDRLLTPEEDAAIAAYLSERYGLSLPHGVTGARTSRREGEPGAEEG